MTRGFMPGVIVKHIRPGSSDPGITPVGVVLHVRAGVGESLFPFFNGPSGGIESHFYIRLDGTIEQYRSIYFEADAQFEGNSFVLDGKRVGFVSVETEGFGEGKWTPAQLFSIKKIIRWVRSESKFPARVCPRWNAPGVGYHTLFGSPSKWTPVAKSCPGPQRIQQFKDEIVPWLKGNEDPMLDPEVKKRFEKLEAGQEEILAVLRAGRKKDRLRWLKLWKRTRVNPE